MDGPLLQHNRSKDLLEGEDPETQLRIWMDDATFQNHVWERLAQLQIYQPLLGDVYHAQQHCRQMSYWRGCTDKAIHWSTPDGEQTGNKKES